MKNKKLKFSTKDYEDMIEYQHKLKEDLVDELDRVYQENLDQALELSRFKNKVAELEEDLKEARTDYIDYCSRSVSLYGLEANEDFYEVGDFVRIKVKADGSEHNALVTKVGRTLFRTPYVETTYVHKGKVKKEKAYYAKYGDYYE